MLLGVIYGRAGDNLPSPKSVLNLLREASIDNIRIYDTDRLVLDAFKGSRYRIIIGMGNKYLKDMSNEDRVMEWVKRNVEPFLPTVVGVCIGNQIFHYSNLEVWQYVLPAMKNVYVALQKLSLHKKVLVSSAISSAVLANVSISSPPSACLFKEDVLPYWKPVFQLLSEINSPIYIDACPYFSYQTVPSGVYLKFLLLESNPGIIDSKTQLYYENMLEFSIDKVYFALEKAGFPKMEVIVETSWPFKGEIFEVGATLENAKIYHTNMHKRLARKEGSPYRPEIKVILCIYILLYENLRPEELWVVWS